MSATEFDFGQSYSQGKNIGAEFAKAIGFVLDVFSRPLGLTTQVLFRQNFGERYFTGIHAVGTYLLIWAATYVSLNVPMPVVGGERDRYGPAVLPIPAGAQAIGIAWILVVLAAHIQQTLAVRSRRAKSVLWHSRCSGVPRIPVVTAIPQYAATLGLMILAAYFGYTGFTLLLLLSLVQVTLSDGRANMQVYHQALDYVDSTIERTVLDRAIAERLPPQRAEGLMAKVPTNLNRVIDAAKKRAGNSQEAEKIGLGEVKSRLPAVVRSGIGEADTILAS